jgi:tRNA-specific 2-thiouridylase
MHIDLGFDKPRNETRIVVAMSGGVDSSVTAALLHEAGYDVIGMTMQLYDQAEAIGKKGACCAGQDIYDARQVADRIGFPHYILDYESKFKQSVIDDFADSYLQGYTPIPCVRCNQTVKFKDMLQAAKDLDADALATGHYVKRVNGELRAELHRAQDHGKDQSFFLFTTTQDQLEFLRFPLGDIPKSVTRDHARRLGLKVADKPDSQDICFVPNGDYAGVISKLRPGALDPGKIVHVDGHELGAHEGTINYTIGQRRGLGVSASDPLYVIRINAATREVVVGPKEHLACREISLMGINWLGGGIPKDPLEITIKIRSTQQPFPATLHMGENNSATVSLHDPEFGVAPGQACVFYENERMLGGGWIRV